MPRLRQITCQIEWPESGLKFEEYGTVYGDGLVETFIAVPDKPQPFCIHLNSKGYIAEGLAMLVYIDGEYQCNRNRLHLKPPMKGQPRHQTEVEFRLRQKEKTIGGGTFIGRDWRFDCHNIVPNGQFPGDFDPSHFDQLGVIEVIVLRCRAKAGDDSGSESLTHESILAEIDSFGQPAEESSAPGEDVENHQPTVKDAPEETEELAGLAGFSFDGAADGHHYSGGDGTADQSRHSGLEGEAPPPGYWTYHLQPPPTHDYRPETRPERRVHFDWGSPRGPSYPLGAPYQQQSRPARGGYGSGSLGPEPSNWQRRGPTNYGSQPTWHRPHPVPTYAEKGEPDWGMPTRTPQVYGGEAPNEYSDYDDLHPYAAPLNMPATQTPAWVAPVHAGPGHSGIPLAAHAPAWTATSNAGHGHAGWNPPPSAAHPVFTPQPQFGAGLGYQTSSVAFPPFCPVPYGFQGPGYTMKYPIPAGGWPGSQAGQRGSLDPAKEENNVSNNTNTQNDSGNQGEKKSWENTTNANNNGDDNQPSGDNPGSAWGDQQPENQQDQTGNNTGGWDNNADNTNNDQQQQQTGQGWEDINNNNDQNSEQQPQTNSGGWNNNNNNNVGQNDQTQGQGLGNWDENNNNDTQPQQPAQDWTSQPGPQPHLAPRNIRPLYGPYGAYYSTHARPTTTLSPTAEAEEEPPFDVPETIAADKGTTHQVQPGKGYLYIHKRASPEYMDGIEEPYARFVFKYRTKEQISRELGIVIECEPTGDEEKRKFTDKTQDELIEMLIRAQNALGGKIPSPPPPATGEEGAKQDQCFNPVPVPAPTAYKYLKYELPKGRNAGLGISGGGNGNGNSNSNNGPQAQAQAQAQQQQQPAQQGGGGGGGDWQMSSSGPPGGWGGPAGQQQAQQSAPNWQTAVESGNANQNQDRGNSSWQNQNVNANATSQSSPADGAWGAAAAAGGGLQEAPPAAGGW